MSERKIVPKSVLEEIYDDMFDMIEESDIFSLNTIQKLKNLAYQDNFKREKSIKEVLESEDDKE